MRNDRFLKVDGVDRGAASFVFVFSGELGESLLDGERGLAYGHVHVDGFHLGHVEFEQPEFGGYTVVGGEGCHVKLKVGCHKFLSGLLALSRSGLEVCHRV